MALTLSEKERLLNMLDKMERSKLQRILASVRSFKNWLYNSLYSIYVKIGNAINSMWNWLCGILK